MRKKTGILILVLSLSPILSPLPALCAPAEPTDQAWRDPLELIEPGSNWSRERFGGDECGCFRALRACLFAATRNLVGCLAGSGNPAREVLCYIKYELDVLLCLERAGICELSCVP